MSHQSCHAIPLFTPTFKTFLLYLSSSPDARYVYYRSVYPSVRRPNVTCAILLSMIAARILSDGHVTPPKLCVRRRSFSRKYFCDARFDCSNFFFTIIILLQILNLKVVAVGMLGAPVGVWDLSTRHHPSAYSKNKIQLNQSQEIILIARGQ